MDEDDDFEFQASGDACELCAALDGTNCATLPHPNCQCQIVPKGKECTSSVSTWIITQYGSGAGYFKVGGELTVTCPDGSEITESFEVDAHKLHPAGDNVVDMGEAITDAFDKEAAALCEQCQDNPEPPAVS